MSETGLLSSERKAKEQSASHKPSHWIARILGVAVDDSGMDNESRMKKVKKLEAEVAEQPSSASLRREICVLLMQCGGRENLILASNHMIQACRSHPYESGLYRVLAAVYLRMGMVQKAMIQRHNAATVRAVEDNPNSPRVHNALGVVFSGLYLPDLAAKHFRRAISLNHRYHVAMRNLAVLIHNSAMAQSDPNERKTLAAGALAEITRALEITRSPRSLLVLASIQELCHSFDKALKAVYEAERLAPGLKGLHAIKSRLLYQIQEEARFAIRESRDDSVERLRLARDRVANFELTPVASVLEPVHDPRHFNTKEQK